MVLFVKEYRGYAWLELELKYQGCGYNLHMATAKMLNKFRLFRAFPGTILPKFNNASLLIACE